MRGFSANYVVTRVIALCCFLGWGFGAWHLNYVFQIGNNDPFVSDQMIFSSLLASAAAAIGALLTFFKIRLGALLALVAMIYNHFNGIWSDGWASFYNWQMTLGALSLAISAWLHGILTEQRNA